MRIVYLDSYSPHIIGQQGETNAVTLRVDVTQWAADFPNGTGVILFTRPNNVIYPLETSTVVLDDKTYLQTIITTKENNVPGWVVLQAQWYNGNTLVKSILFNGKILVSGDALVDPTETVPDWVTEWMETIRTAIDGAGELIEAAETMDADLAASQQAVSDSEAWAKGTRSGEAVEPEDETYHNNSKYYSEQIAATADDVEAWANGTRDGVDIDSDDPAYHKNGKYYNSLAAVSAASAAASASEAMSGIPEGYSNVVASISPNYDGTKTYAIGDYCLNGGKLYRCTTAITEAEAEFVSAHWAEVNVGSEVRDLKNTSEHNTRLLYAKQVTPTFEPGGINNNHGGNVDSNQYIRTNYLRCAYGLQITVAEGYKARVAKYSVDGGRTGFLGWLDGEEWAGTHYYQGPDSYRYRIRIRKDPITSDIVPADGADNVTITVYRTDETLSISLAPADAEKTGQEISKRLNIAEGTEIASGDDLNDYTTPGRYFSHDTSITSSLVNCPITNTGFVMTVEKCSTANYYQQTIRVNSARENEEYHRIKAPNWSEWFKTVDAQDLMNPSTKEIVLSTLKTHSFTEKKTITIATYNVKHYLVSLSSDTTSGIYNAPEEIMNYRKFLMNNGIDLLFLQESEDYLDNNRQKNAFDYLYKYFFIADHNTDSEPFDRYISSARRKVLTRLPFTGQSTELTSVVMTGDFRENWNGYYSWCIAELPGVGNILLINVHNFAHNYTEQVTNRKNLLDNVAALIGQQNGNYDYYIVAGDFNTITSTDYENITSFANSINGTMTNGNMFGWFSTSVTSDRLASYCADNIIVSNNITLKKVSCLPLWSYELFSDHVPVVAKLTFMDAALSLTN